MTDRFDDVNEEQFSNGYAAEMPADMLDFDGEDFDALDAEGDEFFKKAFRRIGRSLKKFKFLRKLAPIAGRIAGGSLGGMLREEELLDFDGEGAEFEDFDGFDSEDEDGEDEALQEDEAEAFGLDTLTDGLAEELAGLASESESEAESAALLGGVTIHILSPAPIAVKRMTPVVLQSATRLGRFLRRSPQTRPLVRTIPTIQRRAVRALVKQAKRGGPVTPKAARAAMAKATYKTLRSPTMAAKGLANNAVKRRRLHRINKQAIKRAER